MSKEGSLKRIEKYKTNNQDDFLKDEQDFYDLTYGKVVDKKEKAIKE